MSVYNVGMKKPTTTTQVVKPITYPEGKSKGKHSMLLNLFKLYTCKCKSKDKEIKDEQNGRNAHIKVQLDHIFTQTKSR